MEVVIADLELGAVALDQAQNYVKMMEKAVTPNDKFKGLTFGKAEDFHAGLAELIGEPDFLNLEAAVKEEHKSEEPFTTTNYNVKSTPRQEWELVLGSDKRLRLDGGVHPKDKVKMEDRVFAELEGLRKNFCDSNGLDLNTFEKNIGLTTLEIACLRLYTGERVAYLHAASLFAFRPNVPEVQHCASRSGKRSSRQAHCQHERRSDGGWQGQNSLCHHHSFDRVGPRQAWAVATCRDFVSGHLKGSSERVRYNQWSFGLW